MVVKDWTERYGEKHNSSRRDRYKNDPEYRDKVKQLRKDYYEKIKSNSKEPVTRELRGKTYQVYRIGVVAKENGVSTEKVRSLEVRGIIPPSSFGRARREYSWTQSKAISKVLEMLDSGEALHKIKNFAAKNWTPH